MEVQLYLDIIKRHIWIIVIVTAVALVLVAIQDYFSTPLYRSNAVVRIILDPGISALLRRSDDNDRLMRTYEFVLSSTPIIESVVKEVSPRAPELTTAQLREQLLVEIVPETELIRITISDGEDPVLTRDLANLFATSLIRYTQGYYTDESQGANPQQILTDQLNDVTLQLGEARQNLDALIARGASTTAIEGAENIIANLEESEQSLKEQYESARLDAAVRANSITVVQPANLPTVPTNALGLTDIALTIGLGLAGGIGLALVLENLNTRIRTPQQLEQVTNLPLLGVVSRGMLKVNGSGQVERGGLLAEAYRLASLNLQRIQKDKPLHKILITSAEMGEGKSMVASNLARIMAEENKTAFLVEGDMRHPSLDKIFNTENGHVGLSSLLVELSSLDQIIHPTEQPSLFVIGAGPIPPNPTVLLASPMMESVINFLGEQGQVTLIDSPPVLGIADVSILAPIVDGVILVARQNMTGQEEISLALKQLRAVQANVIGVIFVQISSSKNSF